MVSAPISFFSEGIISTSILYEALFCQYFSPGIPFVVRVPFAIASENDLRTGKSV
jgi:hypothetical protein